MSYLQCSATPFNDPFVEYNTSQCSFETMTIYYTCRKTLLSSAIAARLCAIEARPARSCRIIDKITTSRRRHLALRAYLVVLSPANWRERMRISSSSLLLILKPGSTNNHVLEPYALGSHIDEQPVIHLLNADRESAWTRHLDRTDACKQKEMSWDSHGRSRSILLTHHLETCVAGRS